MRGPFVYVDTSVVLAHILAEAVTPPDDMWEESLVSSRLLCFETWNRLRLRGNLETHGDVAARMLGLFAFLELVGPIVSVALQGMRPRVRTLDALHLASMLWLREQGAEVRLASYDRRQKVAAEEAAIALYPL